MMPELSKVLTGYMNQKGGEDEQRRSEGKIKRQVWIKVAEGKDLAVRDIG